MAESIDFSKAAVAWTMSWDADWVTAVTFLGPTRTVAAGNNLGEILLWELPDKVGMPTPSPLRRLDGHTNAITRLLSTPDGRHLISASNDHSIRVWDVKAATSGSATIQLNERTREDLKRRGASKMPAPISARVDLQKAERVLEGHREWILGLSLSADGKTLASGDDGGVVIVRDLAGGKEKRRWTVKGWVYALALSPDASRAFVSERVPLVFDSGRHAGAKVWDAVKGEVRLDLDKTYAKEYLSAAVFSPDGKTLALGRGGEIDMAKVTLIDPDSGKKLWETPKGHRYGVTDLAFHPYGKILASAGRDTMIRLWQASDGKLVKELGKPRGGQFQDWIHAISFSADGLWLAAADMVGQVQVWSLAG
jgi:WD40 repeat protein